MAPPTSESSASDTESEHSVRKVPRQESVPDAVDHFLGKLLQALKDRNIPEIHMLYEDTYNKLTSDLFKTRRWPSVASVSSQVSDEPLFLILYTELYYRHVYAKLQPSLTDRKESWENYCKLLDLLVSDLQEEDTPSVALPAQWIWDILDEFVYHYQTYCTFRSKAIRTGKENELRVFRENQDVNKTTKVLTYLTQLVRYSKVEAYLANKEGGTGSAFTDETTRLIGYFSLMQLLRMHSLLGDYHLAMKTIQCIDLHEEVPLFYKIPSVHVTLYYYMGFAYLMMRRYTDSIRTFSDILVFLSKTSGVNQSSYQFEAMVKKQEQMYALLLLALALNPRPIDESLEKTLRDKHGDKQARLQAGEPLCFEELFNFACPKFVSAAPPNWESVEGMKTPEVDSLCREAHNRQLVLFLKEMKEQQKLPKIGSYMKLYTAIETGKLAQLCEMDSIALRDQLMCVMHKTCQKVRSHGAAPLDGVPQHSSEVEFYLDGEMVHINAYREEREHNDIFLEQILKFQELQKKMNKPAPEKPKNEVKVDTR